MDNFETSDGLPKKNNPFAKYGLEFKTDVIIHGPKRPPLYSKTPTISLESGNIDLSSHKAFLERVFHGGKFSIADEREELMGVVGKIFTSATNKRLSDYANFIFMDRQHWDKFKSKIQGNIDEGGNFDAINLGGLIVIGAEGDDKMLPLLFHEVGHSLYTPTNDRFTDELCAYYFQRLSTEVFHEQLKKIGLHYSYPDYDEDDMFPSKVHKDAYQSAATLYIYQSLPELQEQDNSGFSQRMQALLSLIKPNHPK